MAKKTCERELSAIQKLKIENKELRDKNSKLSHFIKHNRHKLTNPDAAEEILQKCDFYASTENKQKFEKEEQIKKEISCPQCHKKKFFEKRFSLPNKMIMIWKQCTDLSCAYKTESKIEKSQEQELELI